MDASQESAIPSETADCYDFPFSTSPVWASKTAKLLRLQGPTVELPPQYTGLYSTDVDVMFCSLISCPDIKPLTVFSEKLRPLASDRFSTDSKGGLLHEQLGLGTLHTVLATLGPEKAHDIQEHPSHVHNE